MELDESGKILKIKNLITQPSLGQIKRKKA